MKQATSHAEHPVAHYVPRGRAAPLVFDVPHAGRVYPDDFRAVVPRDMLEGGEDRFVDELMAHAPSHGAHLVVARFARTYIDPNRRENDLDLSLLSEPWPVPVEQSPHAKLGVGLIFRLIGAAVPIYDRLLSRGEVEHRIARYYRPYHACLQDTLDAIHATRGIVYHVSAHSMSSVGNALSPDAGRQRADFVLGDRDGTSCEPAFTDAVERFLRQLGYSTARNDPYKGAELVARHGKPSLQRHSLQIEMRRGLYMNELTLEKHGGFARLCEDLGQFARMLCEWTTARCAAQSSPGDATGRTARPALREPRG